MAKIVHFVVLGILAIVDVATSDEKCVEPFEKYHKDCAAKDLKGEAIFICTLTSSGVIGENGQLNADRYKELLQQSVIPGKLGAVDAVVQVMQDCLKKAKSVKSPKDVAKAFGNCTPLEPALDELDDALCTSEVE